MHTYDDGKDTNDRIALDNCDLNSISKIKAVEEVSLGRRINWTSLGLASSVKSIAEFITCSVFIS